ncbi:MAG: putative MATE family efflux protein [Paraglaciecola sp.]|jgi:putative MATE family efflux protein
MSKSSRDLTVGSLWRAIAALTLPMIIGIIATMSVSIVDTYFVGKLGTNELAALSFTFPITITIASLAIGLGAGAAAVVSQAIGAKNIKEAKRLATDSLLVATLIVLVISIIGLVTIEPLFMLLGAKGEVLSMIKRYMWIWYISMPFLVIPMVANAIIRAVGDAVWPSIIMVGAAVINIIATPILVFGWGPIPAFNIEGAAYGTLIARVFTLLLALYVAYYREKMIVLLVPALSEIVQSCKKVLKVGIPAGFGSAVNPLGVTIVTSVIATFGADAVAAFGVATRIESFACIPMFALSASIAPIVGQNWGANKKNRVLQAVKYCYLICCVWSAFILTLLYFLAEPISQALASDAALASESASYLGIATVGLWGYGIVIVSAAAFNALGRPLSSLGYYLFRTALLYVPLSVIAGVYFDIKAVYYAIAAANVVSGLVIGWYTLCWLKKADVCQRELKALSLEKNLYGE